jgi:hypothetical protein
MPAKGDRPADLVLTPEIRHLLVPVVYTAPSAPISPNGGTCLFLVDAGTGRGNLIYHRYNGHYGLITSAR